MPPHAADCARVLLRYGADIYVCNVAGASPLSLCHTDAMREALRSAAVQTLMDYTVTKDVDRVLVRLSVLCSRYVVCFFVHVNVIVCYLCVSVCVCVFVCV